MLIIGILNLQGDVEEHETMTKNALKKLEINGKTKLVNTLEDIKKCNALIISGGESSTIGMHLKQTGIDQYLKDTEMPIFGTCAGLVLLATQTNKEQPLLNFIDMNVERNAFGRQRLSFESEIEFNNEKYHGIFIRAPAINNINDDTEILSTYNDKIIAVRKNQYLAIAFHPELTNDTRIHEYFIKEVIKCVE